jgi:hypothetical protein
MISPTVVTVTTGGGMGDLFCFYDIIQPEKENETEPNRNGFEYYPHLSVTSYPSIEMKVTGFVKGYVNDFGVKGLQP